MDSGLRSCTAPSPIGELLLVASDRGLVQVFLPTSKGVPSSSASVGERHDPKAHCLPAARTQLDAFFAGELRDFDLPLDERGSCFQLRVWSALRSIPFGTTCSYGDLATRIGEDPRVASRAVGLANGRNPNAIVTPCHRVIGADGSLVGYAGGLHQKRWLLDHEAQAVGSVLF